MATNTSTISNFATKTHTQVIAAVNTAHQSVAPTTNATLTAANSRVHSSSVLATGVNKQVVECVQPATKTRVYIGTIDATTGDLTLIT